MSILTTQAQWTSEPSGFSVTPLQRGIIEMVAVNANNAWAMSYLRGANLTVPLNEITRTVDGGNTWNPLYIGGIPNDVVLGIAPVSSSTCYAISWDIVNYTGGRILKTADGGSNWSTISDTATMFAGGFPDNIAFFDANNGVANGDPNGGYHEIYTTSNGGATWTRVQQANIPAMLENEYGIDFSMCTVNNTVWFETILGDYSLSRIFKSYDKGLHWVAYTNAITGIVTNGVSIKMRDQNHGLLKTSTPTSADLFRTSDGGITWTHVNPSGNFFAFDLAFVHGTTETWVSTGGEPNNSNGIGSSYSTDDGNTWTTIDTGVDHQAIDMVNQYVGFCGGFNTSPTVGGIFNYTGGAIGCGCIAPSNTATANVAATTAYASWTQPSCYYNNSIRISKHGLNSWTTYNFNNSHYTFSALSRNTMYDWQVRTNCNPAMTSNSDWTAIQTFNTLASRDEGFANNADYAFNVYPNPANDHAIVSFNATTEDNYNIRLIDITGRIIQSVNYTSIIGENQYQMSLSSVAKGVYNIILQNGSVLMHSKIVIQ